MNSKVLMPSCPLLLAGADVTHQQGFGDTSPSVVAVVASMDRFLTRFAADVFMQGPRVEIIQVRAAPPAANLLLTQSFSMQGPRVEIIQVRAVRPAASLNVLGLPHIPE